MGKNLKLADFMGEGTGNGAQTPDEMLANLRRFKAGLGSKTS